MKFDTVAICDDDEVTRDLLVRMFEAAGASAEAYAYAVDLPEQLIEAPKSLLVLDHAVGSVHGHEILRQLRHQEEARGLGFTPVLVISGAIISEIGPHYADIPLVRFLQKPVSLGAVRGIVNDWPEQGGDARNPGSTAVDLQVLEGIVAAGPGPGFASELARVFFEHASEALASLAGSDPTTPEGTALWLQTLHRLAGSARTVGSLGVAGAAQRCHDELSLEGLSSAPGPYLEALATALEVWRTEMDHLGHAW